MEVKKEITKDTSGGRRTFVVTPDMGNVMLRKSMNSVPPGNSMMVSCRKLLYQSLFSLAIEIPEVFGKAVCKKK
jgi:hypothetical protein